jgi:cyclopropane fatty-acyl-phospholipid synthase-like methyltransferase
VAKKKKIGKLILKRFINPIHLFRIIRLQRNRKKHKKVYNDAELKLYHQILPGDHLHYGYFEQTDVHPQDISINMIYRAQERYAMNLVDLISDRTNSVLDIGCGMGGLLGLMNKTGINAIGLTPDINQAKHIGEKYPNELLQMRFEDLDGEKYKSHFGTVITSESLQYLNYDIAIPLINKILKSGGKWIACDYFRIGQEGEKSGHNWKAFEDALQKNGFRVTYQKDITPNILPTIAYVHNWCVNLLFPVKDFAISKMKVKAPGYHYAMEEALPEIETKLQGYADIVDPKIFAANKQYILMTIERS